MNVIQHVRRRALAALCLATILMLTLTSARAEEQKIVSAFAVVTSSGRILPAGDGGFRIMSTVEGPFFVDTGKGPIDAGDITCVANMRGDGASGLVSGEGSCVVLARDGARLLADWRCEGVMFVGCRGEFVVTGGDGRLAGVSGGGQMTARTSEAQIQGEDGHSLAAVEGRGILFWDDLTFVLP